MALYWDVIPVRGLSVLGGKNFNERLTFRLSKGFRYILPLYQGRRRVIA